jgi:hypothetical protein
MLELKNSLSLKFMGRNQILTLRMEFTNKQEQKAKITDSIRTVFGDISMNLYLMLIQMNTDIQKSSAMHMYSSVS